MKSFSLLFLTFFLLTACSSQEENFEKSLSSNQQEEKQDSDRQASHTTIANIDAKEDDPMMDSKDSSINTNENDNAMAGDPNLDQKDREDYISGKIKLDQPLMFEKISSPLTIKGQAIGSWFFEASIPVKLLDQNGKELAKGAVNTSQNWMTEDMVSFEGSLTFDPGKATSGTLVLEKENPSGITENAQKVEIPVKF